MYAVRHMFKICASNVISSEIMYPRFLAEEKNCMSVLPTVIEEGFWSEEKEGFV